MSRIASFFLALTFVAGVGLASAQESPAFRRLPPPTIKVPPEEQAIEVTRYALDVQVRGLFAETTATMVLRNPNARQLEGELEFPLPDDATISGYALDVAGRMVDGVVVGKDRARVVLETERRTRRDPGLVEQVRGNAFRTRIFPLPPMGTRTVKITWVSTLAVRRDEAVARIPLPASELPALELRVVIDAEPAVEPELTGFGNLTLTRWENQRKAEATFANVTPGDDLLVRLPRLPATLVATEGMGDETFVAISDAPRELPSPAPPKPPRRVAVAWDASGSRTPDGIARARSWLLELAKLWPTTIFDVVVFRDVAEPSRAFEGSEALVRFLDGLPYDGGTGLATLDLRRAALPNRSDALWLLATDGLGTVGEGLPHCGDVPVVVAVSDTGRDLPLLRLLAARSGGDVVDLALLGAEAAAARVSNPPFALLRAEARPGVLDDLQILPGEGRSTLLARLRQAGEVTLVYGRAGEPVHRTKVRVDPADAPKGGIVARAWAGARAADLAVFAELNRDELIRLGQRYRLVTPETSLLVLESLDQYLRHRVEPPATWPEMRERYLSAMKGRAQQDLARGRDQLERVVGEWRKRVEWWEGKVARPAKEKGAEPRDAVAEMAVIEGGVEGGVPGGVVGGVPGGVVGSTPTPRPAPPAPPPPREEVAREMITVTGESPVVDSRSTTTGESFEALPIGRNFSGIVATGDSRQKLESLGYLGGAQQSRDAATESSSTVTPFDPDTPWLRALKGASPGDAYPVYLEQRRKNATSPSFFLDSGAFFLPRDRELGRRVLSNLGEMKLDDPALLRSWAWKLEEADELAAAIVVFRKVLRLRPEEPQSQRDLALALARRAEASGEGALLTEAMALLHRVILREAPEGADLGEREVLEEARDRFRGLEVIACEELNRMMELASRKRWDRRPQFPPLDPRLRKNLDTDLRIVMGWDADATDIDLHVLQPDGEEAYYGRNLTHALGLVSPDVTQGYGPEEYLIRKAIPGTYGVRCRYFGSRAQTLLGPATVTATIFLDWGRPNERRQTMSLRLEKTGDQVPVGEITVGPGSKGIDGRKGERGGLVTREQLRSLTKGMSRPKVEERLGPPERVDRGGLTVLVYRLEGGNELRLSFGPELVSAKEILDGAERELLR